MPDLPISGLPAVTTPLLTDEHAVDQAGLTKKETNAQIQESVLQITGSSLNPTSLIINSLNSTQTFATNSQIFGGDNNNMFFPTTDLSTIVGGKDNAITGNQCIVSGSTSCEMFDNMAKCYGSISCDISSAAGAIFASTCEILTGSAGTIVSGSDVKIAINTTGAYAWSDAGGTDFNVSTIDSWNIRARGGAQMVLGTKSLIINSTGADALTAGDTALANEIKLGKGGIVQTKSSVSNGTIIGEYNFFGDSGSGEFKGALLRVEADAIPTATATPMSIELTAVDVDAGSAAQLFLLSEGSFNFTSPSGIFMDMGTSSLTVGDQVGSDVVDLSALGVLLEGTARFKQQVSITAREVAGGGLQPPSQVVLFGNKAALQFTNAQEKEIFLDTVAGFELDTNEVVEVQVLWSPSSVDTGVCEWKLDFSTTVPGATIDNTITTFNLNSTAPGTADQLTLSPITTIAGSNFPQGNLISARFYRPNTDTFTGNANFFAIIFTAVNNKLGGPI